jgi:drug/metabolite transporter (DMT)-like permease
MSISPAIKARLPDIALWLVSFVWGGTFLVTRTALEAGAGPFFFISLRFGVAAIVTALLLRGRLKGTTREDWIAAIAIGVPMAAGYLLQTLGLRTISSSMSAFLSALYVPLVPLIQWIALRRVPRAMTWVGIVFAFIGLVMIAHPAGAGFSLGLGGALTLASALAFAAEIILIGHYAERIDGGRVAAIDLAIVAIAGLVAMAITGEPAPAPSHTILFAGAGLGVASAFIQIAMNWAQRTVSPTRATLIYASEPVFAGAFGRLAGERLSASGWMGAALILAGVVVSEIKPRRWRANPDH